MKYSQRQNNELTIAQINNANKWNLPLLADLKKRFGFVPAGLEDEVRSLNKRIAKIVPMIYEDFDDRWKGVAILRDALATQLVDSADKKTGFAVLYVYHPELDKMLKAHEAERMKKRNHDRLTSLFQKQGGEANETLEEFILTLPTNIPYQAYFDGSRERVINLSKGEGAVMYGDASDDVFAVVYSHRDAQVITFFVNGLDYVRSFANQLEKQLEINEETAMQISGALQHDRYYSIQTPFFTDFEKYTTNMARLLKVSEGDVVNDLCQGPVDVITGVFSQKLALDLDDELLSAVLIGGRVNVYLPSRS
jgi:hypothetical protein